MQTILYIEDSAVNTYIVKKIVKSLGYAVIVAYDGREGIKLAQTQTPDLILIDLVLPDMHGLDVIKYLRSINTLTDTPMIALTATDSPAMKVECLEAGYDDYLEKPVSQGRLAHCIEHHFGIQLSN